MFTYLLLSFVISILVIDALKIVAKVNKHFFFNKFWGAAGVVVSFIPVINVVALVAAVVVRYLYIKNHGY